MAGDKNRRRILIVDGYNVINARKTGAVDALADARDTLLSELMDYAGYSGQKIILVFDAWLSNRMQRTVEQHGQVQVVYTQKGETADHYIERLCDAYAEDIEMRRIEVRVATSDGMEQTIVLGRGAMRLSARELAYEMEQTRAQSRMSMVNSPSAWKKNTVIERLPENVREKLEAMRRGQGS